MKFLVTGGAGFAGSHVVRTALARGHAVTVAVRKTTDTARLSGLDVEVLRDAQVGDVLRVSPDVVVHAAWVGNRRGERENPKQINNIAETVSWVEHAASAGARYFLGLGSQAEYTSGCHSPLYEKSETIPATLYGATKLSAGLVAGRIAAQRRLPFAWVRLFSIFGPGDHPESHLPQVAAMLQKHISPALSPSSNIWDYLPAPSAAEAIVRLAEVGATGTFNLGSGAPHTMRDILNALRDRFAPGLRLRFGEGPYPADVDMFRVADCFNIRRATGWTPVDPIQFIRDGGDVL